MKLAKNPATTASEDEDDRIVVDTRSETPAV
jgi:hypothetical protein